MNSQLQLGWVQFGVLSAALALILFGSFLLLGNALAERYVLEVQGPPLERAFGFIGAFVPVAPSHPDPEAKVFAITHVTPGGRLEQAGFRVGNRPSVGVCPFQGRYVQAQSFYNRLEVVLSGEFVEFGVAGPEGLAAYRRVVLRPVPPGRQ